MFFGKYGGKMGPWTDVALPKVVVLGQVFLMSYHRHQTKIVCQSYDPGKLMYQFTQNEAHNVAFHLLGLGFGMGRVLHCFSTINRPLSLIVTQFKIVQRHVAAHLFSEISYHHPSWFISISGCKHISVFSINEMKYYFRCISLFMVISVIYCVPV